MPYLVQTLRPLNWESVSLRQGNQAERGVFMYGAMTSLDSPRVLAGQEVGKIGRTDLDRGGLVPRLNQRREAPALLRALR